MKHLWIGLLLVLATLTAGAYFLVAPTAQDHGVPAVIRVGVLPDEADEILYQRYTPLLEYLSRETGLQTRLIIPADYGELVRLFANNELELAYFGGLTFVQSFSAHDAEPLVMRDVDTRFTSWFLVRSDSPVQSLADLKGKKFSFGSELSTSGHLMPRHFLQLNFQITPEEFFSAVHYSGAHDATVYRVLGGESDVGVSNSQVVRRMVEDGRVQENEFRVLWESPPYVDYTWAVHSHLNGNLKTLLRDAFLGMRADDPIQADILAGVGAKAFLPAGIKDFAPLKQIVEDLGMLEPELP